MRSGSCMRQDGYDGRGASGSMIRIENARLQDIREIAVLHRQVFPGFFLTAMGQKFLEELYSGFLNHPGGLLIVARDGESVVGFAAGTTEPDIFFPTLRKQRGGAFLVKAIPAILANPLPVLRKLYSAVFYRGDAPHDAAAGALLSSIGVAAALQGSGLAEKLLMAFESNAASKGAVGIYLTTDATNNDRVNAFYRKKGYEVESRFMQHGRRPMFRYIKKLTLGNEYGK